MGKISILTKEQKNILDLISQDSYFVQNFYFTGGTVLSEFYLHHRYFEDLDFFSEKQLDQQVILTLMTKWGEKLSFRFNSRFVEVVFRFDLFFKNGKNFKVDFEDFAGLPKMIKPLTLNQLKIFFREKAIEVGKKSVIP